MPKIPSRPLAPLNPQVKARMVQQLEQQQAILEKELKPLHEQSQSSSFTMVRVPKNAKEAKVLKGNPYRVTGDSYIWTQIPSQGSDPAIQGFVRLRDIPALMKQCPGVNFPPTPDAESFGK